MRLTGPPIRRIQKLHAMRKPHPFMIAYELTLSGLPEAQVDQIYLLKLSFRETARLNTR